MNLSDVLAEIREKYPNSNDDASLIRKADLIQKRVYRQLKKENWETVDLLTDQAEYQLTIDQHNVFQVDVRDASSGEFSQYPLRNMSDKTHQCDKYHYFVSTPDTGDWIGLYPSPTDSEDVMTIYYYEVPAALTDTNSSLTLYENYRMLLVYGVCVELAENAREMDLANGFMLQYKALERELLGLIDRSDDVTVWSRW